MGALDWDAVRRSLDGLEYPCDRKAVIEHAAAHGADDDLLGHVGALPEREFNGRDEVDAALGRA